MKYFEFLDEFAKVAHEFKILKNGLIRAGEECPITRLCRELTEAEYEIGQSEWAATALDLDYALAQEIADSADNVRGRGWHFSARTRRDLTQLIEKGKLIRGTKGK